MPPYVSVIVPVFNVADYIEKCAKSLFDQTLKDIEYIFVNDSSTDNSIEILKKVVELYPDRKDSVYIYDMDKNSGVAAVRKEGIMHSHGQYIIHCDSDDWIDKDMYEIMYEKARTDSLDMLLCDFIEEKGNEVEYHHSMNETRDVVASTINNHGSLCIRMVSSRVVKSPCVIFPIENIGEDLALSGQYAVLSERSGYIERAFYHYVRRDTSILGNRSDFSLLKMHYSFKTNFSLVMNLMTSKGLDKDYEDELIHECVFIKNVLLPVLPAYGSYGLWKHAFEDINNRVLGCKLLTLREKVNFIITYIGLYPVYKKLKF